MFPHCCPHVQKPAYMCVAHHNACRPWCRAISFIKWKYRFCCVPFFFRILTCGMVGFERSGALQNFGQALLHLFCSSSPGRHLWKDVCWNESVALEKRSHMTLWKHLLSLLMESAKTISILDHRCFLFYVYIVHDRARFSWISFRMQVSEKLI